MNDDDMLAAFLPRARIMTFGYNANVALSTTKADLRDCAVQFLTVLNLKRDLVGKAFHWLDEEVTEIGR